MNKRRMKYERRMRKKNRCVCGFCPAGVLACHENFMRRYPTVELHLSQKTKRSKRHIKKRRRKKKGTAVANVAVAAAVAVLTVTIRKVAVVQRTPRSSIKRKLTNEQLNNYTGPG
ncbi:hypothetical protein EG68_06965 [Paragonimus skrjabini miyazakii]|uniref:Uncharacterized protein n=1 Tax=Paragonimus skrjabini miyazakii TaxID=59628 RepID=A0A8S9YRC8_9TREM|nr:hypothetical protein EG68_06965 [Paragonimus skrjabini miyazakii]